MIQYINELNTHNTIVSNLIQGTYWKTRSKSFYEKLVIPIILYYDDYVNNNPFGSHKGIAKSGGVYISIPVLPVQHQAKISTYFCLYCLIR